MRLNAILISALLAITGCATADVGVIVECDFVAHERLRDVSYHYEICSSSDADTEAFQQSWIIGTCEPEAGSGDCSGGCVAHNANLCFL